MKGAIVTQDGKGSQWEFLSVSYNFINFVKMPSLYC